MARKALPGGVLFHGRWQPRKKLFTLGTHKNPGLEIVLLTRGKLRWEVEGQAEDLRPGMLFFTLPWQEHGGVEEVQKSATIAWICLALSGPAETPRKRFGFHPSLGLQSHEEAAISTALVRSRHHAIPASADFAWLLEAWFAGAERRDGMLQESRLRDLLKLLLLELARCVHAHAQNQIPDAGSAEATRRIRRFIRVLAKDFTEPWTLATMSGHCGLGRTQFAEELKRETGDTPITFLNRLRIERAQALLRDPRRPVTQIAFDVGFNSSQYFATVFRQFTGIEPRAWRAQAGVKSRWASAD